MSTYLGILEKNLFHSEDVIKTDISECVSYSWAKKYTKTFMKSDSLTKYAKNFINDVITNKVNKTIKNNNIEIHKARNAYYIDVDYEVITDSVNEVEQFNNRLAKLFKMAFVKTINKLYKTNNKENDSLRYYYFTFLASEFPNRSMQYKDSYIDVYKGGIHILVFMNNILSNDERLNIYNEMVNYITDFIVDKADDTLQDMLSNIYLKTNTIEDMSNKDNVYKLVKSIFDYNPIKSCNILFPFGQKDPNKRQYNYVKELSLYNDENFFILDTYQEKTINVDNNKPLTDAINDVVYNINIIDSDDDSEDIITSYTSTNGRATNDTTNTNNINDSTRDTNISTSSTNDRTTRDTNTNDTRTNDDNINDDHVYINRGRIKIKYHNMLPKKAILIYNFVDSFKYISNNHSIIKKMLDSEKHNEYYYDLCKTYYYMLIIIKLYESDSLNDFNNYIWKHNESNHGIKANDITLDILELVSKQMANICKSTLKTIDVSNLKGRYSWSEQLDNMRSMFIDNNSIIYKLFKEKLFVRERDSATEELKDELSMFDTLVNTYYVMRDYNFDVYNKRFCKDFNNIANNRHLCNMISRYIIKFNNICKSEIIDKFIMLIKEFSDGLTNEIEPFNKLKSYNHQICYKDEIDNEQHSLTTSTSMSSLNSIDKERLSFCDIDPMFYVGNVVKDTTYDTTIKTWMHVMLIFNYINSSYELEAAIKKTIGSFIKNYVSVIMSATTSKSSNSKKILIYNIRQITEMEKYPYNQWILDNNKYELTSGWITKLYTHYIEYILENINNKHKFYGFMEMFCNNKLITDKFVLRKIKPLPHSDKNLTEMLLNIIKTHPTEARHVPTYIPIETSNIFPMRNGWLKFYWRNNNTKTGYDRDQKYKNGATCDIIFERDNKSNYSESYTNIPWVGDENAYMEWINKDDNEQSIKAKEAYNKIKSMCEQIYPIKEEHDYNMSLFASVLYGDDTKDVIHIMFGTGSDGKTTMMNALFSMLDAKGYTNDVYIRDDDGRTIQLESLNGLASVMKAEALLTTNKPGSHDEGGKACIAHMRLVSVQEPDQHLSGGNLNGAAIKELTSGAAISTRKIYGEAESVQANALITFQTNDMPGTDDTSKGFRRRLSVYTHRSKFKTSNEQQEDKSIRNMKYHYVADPTLNDLCRKDIYLKQAMFYYLLPYARYNKTHNIKDLQKIKKPECVENDINKVISKSTGEHKWICENITSVIAEDDNNVVPIININKLIKLMIARNRALGDDRMWQSNKNSNKEINNISVILQNYFEGDIFKLKEQYYDKRYKPVRLKTRNDKEFSTFINTLTNPETDKKKISKLLKDYNIDELRNKYLEEYAINALSMSECNEYQDLFLIGYKLVEDKNKEDTSNYTNDLEDYFDE